MQDGFFDRHARERLAEVVHLALIINGRVAQYFLQQRAQHFFGEIHQVAIIRIGLVKLQHGEFRIVARRQPFVAEIAVDFKHALEATHHQTL